MAKIGNILPVAATTGYDPAMTPRILPSRLLRTIGFVLSALVFPVIFGALGVDQTQGATPTEAGPSEVQTEPAEATANGFKLRGRLNPEGSLTTYYFRYKDAGFECEDEFGCGPTTRVGGPLTGDTQQEVLPIEVAGLEPGQTYRYWLIASNANGMTRGRELTFTTPAGAPPAEVQTEPAEATANGFKLRGRLNPEGSLTTYYFRYKDAGFECEDEFGCGPTTRVGGPLTGDTQQEVLPIEVAGLEPGQTYRYWLIASNANGMTRGGELTFVTGTSSSTETLQAPLGTLSIVAPPTTSDQSGGSSQSGVTSKLPVLKTHKLPKALGACRKKPTSERAACEKQARKRYGTVARKASRRSKARA